MKRCGECRKSNPDAARYCMGCGKRLKDRKPLLGQLGILGSFFSGFSLAPLVQMSTENGAGTTLERPVRRATTAVPIQPKADGTWFCPDCGHRNDRFATLCADCGREPR